MIVCSIFIRLFYQIQGHENKQTSRFEQALLYFPPMTISDYQERARATAIYPNVGSNFVYPTLGLAGETGEVAEHIKKAMRDEGVITDARRELLQMELGDVLWYLATLATELNLDLQEIAETNLHKLAGRQAREVLHGDGDSR